MILRRHDDFHDKLRNEAHDNTQHPVGMQYKQLCIDLPDVLPHNAHNDPAECNLVHCGRTSSTDRIECASVEPVAPG